MTDIETLADDLRRNAVTTSVNDKEDDLLSVVIDAGLSPDGEARLKHIDFHLRGRDVEIEDATILNEHQLEVEIRVS